MAMRTPLIIIAAAAFLIISTGQKARADDGDYVNPLMAFVRCEYKAAGPNGSNVPDASTGGKNYFLFFSRNCSTEQAVLAGECVGTDINNANACNQLFIAVESQIAYKIENDNQ